jgi:hypothetical protein
MRLILPPVFDDHPNFFYAYSFYYSWRVGAKIPRFADDDAVPSVEHKKAS